MRTPTYLRYIFAPLAAVAVLGVFSSSSLAQGSGSNSVPTVPLVNIRASVPETSEPLCDPDLCDAPTPAPGVFVVSRAGDLARELTVFLRHRGTASNSVDYRMLPASVLFRGGVSAVELFVEARHDTLPEGDETVLAELMPNPTIPSYNIVAPLPARVVIHDNDLPVVPVVSIWATSPETREPLCPPNTCLAPEPAPGIFVISRSGDLTQGLAVRMRYSGTAIGGADYAPLPEWVQFPASAASVELQVRASFDGLSEGDETVVAELQPDPSLGPIERYRVDPAQSAARVVIHDNEAPPEPVVSIAATSPIAEESSYPYRRLPLRGQFTISRTGPTNNALPVFVHYSGSATPGVDYPFLPWLVSIPPGTNRVEIEIVPNPDDKREPIEIVEATLSECPPLTDPPLGIPCYLLNIDPAHASARVFIRDDGITTASLEITAPKDGAEFGEGSPIHIAATAIDPDGAITHVDFFDGDVKIGESTLYFFREPDPGTPIFHEFEWRGAAAGPHVLTARAVDAAGNAVTSAPVRVSVGGGLPVVSIEATVPETTEPSPTTRIRPGVFTLRRTGDAGSALRVWMHYGGTATSGADYVAPPIVVEFPAGASSVEVMIGPLDDELVEGDETVIGQLTPSPLAVVPEYRIDPVHNQARIIIHDAEPPGDLPVIAFEGSTFEVTEPSIDGATIPSAPIKRSGAAPDLILHFQISGTATEGIDYLEIRREHLYPSGASGIGIGVIPLPDLVREDDETVIIRLVQPEGGNSGYRIDPQHDTAVFTIHDSPPLPVPVVRIAATRPETTEPFLCRSEPCPLGPVAAPGAFTIMRSAPLDQALEIYVAYHGTARAGEDYLELPGVVVIPAGRDSLDLQIIAKGDDLVEGDETVEAVLRPDSLFILTPHYLVDPEHSMARVIIHDNTPPAIPVVSILATRPETHEPLCPPNTCLAPTPAPGVFVISRHGGDLANALTVLLQYGGSALPRLDYTPLPEWVEIPAGQESVELLVTALFDEFAEGDESVVAALQPDPSLRLIERYRIDPAQALSRVIIHDRTPPVIPIVTIVATDPFAREGTNPANVAVFEVRRMGETNSNLTVLLAVGGTAGNGSDYGAIPNQVTIPAGSRSTRILVAPIDDNVREKIETVIIELLNPPVPLPIPAVPPSYFVGRPGRAAAIIVDNDVPRPPCIRLPDGLFNVCVPMDPSHCFRVESTHDLKVWTPLCTVPVNEGMAHYVDSDAATSPQQFYRLVPVACDLEE